MFRGPAHRHAHHLHSIPPREKSTRTLIIDHMLWVHARTRFAQARAELAMSDPSGGPHSINYHHRARPERYDEDDDLDTEQQHNVHDLPLAADLRTRADGLENVITSMLHQPPPIHDDVSNPTHLHRLPNGVRLRLALGSIINHLFAPSHHTIHPQILRPLATISAAFSPHINNNLPRPSQRTTQLYFTPSESPSPRCSRHLQFACHICTVVQPRSSPSTFSLPSKSTPGIAITGYQEGTGIGSGLLRPSSSSSSSSSSPLRQSKNNNDLIPRFLRLSALVAAELGREARGEEVDVDTTSSEGPGSVPSSPNFRKGSETARMYENALRPSREWYLLLAGLLTRVALEGYLVGGWSGLQPLQCLMMVGFGVDENYLGVMDDDEEEDGEEDELFAAFEPDEMPDLVQAFKILFPISRPGSFGVKDQAEEEYEVEMLERLRKFYDVPLSTTGRSSHLQMLAEHYQAETVERSAVRYCEAIARWRGKPELETYKKKPPLRPIDEPIGPSPMTIESLVHSNPTSPHSGGGGGIQKMRKPSIDVYFPKGQVTTATATGAMATPLNLNLNLPLRSHDQNQGSTWDSSLIRKRFRDVEDVGRVEESIKRVFVG